MRLWKATGQHGHSVIFWEPWGKCFFPLNLSSLSSGLAPASSPPRTPSNTSFSAYTSTNMKLSLPSVQLSFLTADVGRDWVVPGNERKGFSFDRMNLVSDASRGQRARNVLSHIGKRREAGLVKGHSVPNVRPGD